jgi:circadian clock protein KaiC
LVFTVADSLIVLKQTIERNSIVRKIEVVKLRGQGDLPGFHTFRITRDGLKMFPRLPKPEADPGRADALQAVAPFQERLSTGVRGRDEMLGGGIPRAYSAMAPSPPARARPCWPAVHRREGELRGARRDRRLREAPRRLPAATALGDTLGRMIHDGQITMVYLRPLDLSVDETL